MNRLHFIAIAATLPLLALLTTACTEEEEYPEGCVQGQRCDPASADNDYCPQDDCNWCSCAADGTWACTASTCEEPEDLEEDEPCRPGLVCDPEGPGADYCPWGDCNWCTCEADGTWACTASAACDMDVSDMDPVDMGAPDVGPDASTDGGEEDVPCRPGLACDPDAPGADYCPWDECNWCSCGADDTWMCTASSCMDAGAPDGGA